MKTKSKKTAHIVILILGIVNLGFAIFDIASGQEWSKFWLSLFIGVTLTGVGIINLRKTKKSSTTLD